MEVPQAVVEEVGQWLTIGIREVIRSFRTRRPAEEPEPPAQPPTLGASPPWQGKSSPWGALEAPSAPSAPSSYAQSMGMPADHRSTACVNCTRRHLWAMRKFSEAAAEAAARGDEEEARRRALQVVGEATALKTFDWTPQQLANLRGREATAIHGARPHVEQLLQEAPAAPAPLVTAWSVLDEAQRFARSAEPTPSDLENIQARLDEAGAQLTVCETDLLPQFQGDDRAWMEEVTGDMRTVRQELADHLNGRQPLSKERLGECAQFLREVAEEMTPVPAPEEAQAMAARAAAAEEAFRTGLFRDSREAS